MDSDEQPLDPSDPTNGLDPNLFTPPRRVMEATTQLGLRMTQVEDGQWKVAGEGELPGPNVYYARQQYATAWETIYELGSDLCVCKDLPGKGPPGSQKPEATNEITQAIENQT